MSLPRLRHVAPAIVVALLVGVALRSRPADASLVQFTDPYCWHDRWVVSSEWHCGDTTSSPSASAFTTSFAANFAEPDSLRVKLRSGRVFAVALHPGVDGIFLGTFAVKTFLVPYFESNGLSGEATRLRTHVDAQWRPSSPERMMLVCERIPAPQHWVCPDSARTIRINPANVEEVQVITHGPGSRRSVRTPGPGVDAIFLSREAATRYLLPYYQRKVDGLSAAIAARWP